MTTHAHRLHFASDNYAGICPEALTALQQANDGYEYSYGDDRWTAEACDLFRSLFECDCEVYFVFNGTAANSLALAALGQSYHSRICHEHAHVETDECGAPEFFSHGSKLLLAQGANGKMDPASIGDLVTRRSDIHYPKPRVVSITQATEMGTVYTPAELQAIQAVAVRHRLKLHMDGARLANAIASLEVKPRAVAQDSGIDVLCFGGSKNGLSVGEAVIFFDLAAAEEFAFRCKQAGQLASKMRFLAAQWVGLLRADAWLQHARHANQCAALLAERVATMPGVRLMFPRQANSVFVQMSPAAIAALRDCGWHFYTFIGVGGARFMCSWSTREADVLALAADLETCAGRHPLGCLDA